MDKNLSLAVCFFGFITFTTAWPYMFSKNILDKFETKQKIEPSINVNKFDILSKPPSFKLLPRQETSEGTNPWFCHNLDCPPYTVVKKTDKYEKRRYEKTRWVVTHMEGTNFKIAQYKMFMKLFDYISGENDKGQKIEMTAPVLVKLIPGQGPYCKDDFIMGFYVSANLTDPPKPKDKTVALAELSKQDVFVQSFGGFATESADVKTAENLSDELDKDGEKYSDAFFYYAGYDSPTRFKNRHNEVWLVAE